MNPTHDARPPGLNLLFRPGTTVTLSLHWLSAGALTGREFSSTLGDQDLVVVMDGDAMTVTATAEVTDTLTAGRSYQWVLAEEKGAPEPEPVIVGTWTASDAGARSPSKTVHVTEGAVTVAVSLIGGGGGGQVAGVLSVAGETGHVTLAELADAGLATTAALDDHADDVGPGAHVPPLGGQPSSYLLSGDGWVAPPTGGGGGPTTAAELAFVPAGTIGAGNVQAAIEEVSGDVGALAGALVVNVRDHGAVGDGATDDAPAIQAAIDGAPAGSVIYFPPGTYDVAAPVRLRGRRAYVGAGHALAAGSVIRQAAGANLAGPNGVTGVLVSEAWWSDAESCDEPIRIHNLAVDGNSPANTGNACGIVLCGYWSWVTDCYVARTPLDGILLTDRTQDGTDVTNSASENRIARCRILNSGRHGIHQESHNTISNQDGYCVDNLISGTGPGLEDSAIRFQRGSGWVFRRNHAYDSGGIFLDNCYATVVAENEVEVFGPNAGAGDYVGGISVRQLDGRGSHVVNNLVSLSEVNEAAGGYQFINVTGAFGATDAHAVVTGNIVYGPAPPAPLGSTIGVVLDSHMPGGLTVEVASNRVWNVNTESYFAANAVVHAGATAGDVSGAVGALSGSLADVATSGAYADLTGSPTIPTTAGDVGADPAGTADAAVDAHADVIGLGAHLPADGADGDVLTWSGGDAAWAPTVLAGSSITFMDYDDATLEYLAVGGGDPTTTTLRWWRGPDVPKNITGGGSWLPGDFYTPTGVP